MTRFKKFRTKHGAPSQQQTVPAASFELYADTLPAELLDEWRASGWCAYGDGFLWTVDPAEYRPILADWVEADDLYPFLRTAFGDLFYWNGQDTVFLDVQEGDSTVVFRRMDMLFDGMLCDDRTLNDLLQHATFKRARSRLGTPARDEVYAFVPPPATGGSGEVETLQRVKLREQLAILAQLAANRIRSDA